MHHDPLLDPRDEPTTDRLRDRPDASSSEVVVRNLDHARSYTATVTCTPRDEPTRTATETHRLRPGEIRCLSTLAPRGPTTVTARLGTGSTDTSAGPLSDAVDETALIEVGNGVVSVTHGL